MEGPMDEFVQEQEIDKLPGVLDASLGGIY
jgi:hypothetical protein